MSTNQQASLVGTRIREYEILEVIGKGGMGTVCRARHSYLGEERAIKVIRAGLPGDQHLVDRFLREARILTRLRHPNLVQFHEFGTLGEGIYFMVMELIRGESALERIQRRGRISVPDALRIAREAALGLHSAHEQGIVHRDISPDNLLIVTAPSGEEHVKIIDFGIAKPLFEKPQQLTITNVFVGKAEYCSPEQCGLMEEGETIDRRSDMYSLGVTLYHMLAGRLPFYATTPQGYLLKHASETPQPLAAHFQNDQLPAVVDAIVMKMMSRKRQERYATMYEVAHDLEQAGRMDFSSGAFGHEDRLRNMPLPATSRDLSGFGELQPGALFAGRYVIEKQLGRGGMGIVYKATDKYLAISVALKTLNNRISESPAALERLKNEVILARKVTHPNACRIYDFGESDGTYYISMEFLDGRTLAEILESDGRLTPEVGLPIFCQILQALQEAHSSGVIHRDLKPENIMIDAQQKASILDFGISTSTGSDLLLRPARRIGSPGYMAPEQVAGRGADARSDIYSVGVLMFETLTGDLPADLQSPSQIIPDFPSEVEAVILKALARDPSARFQKASDLLKALQPYVHPFTSELTLEGNTLESARRSPRHTLVLLVAMAIILIGAFLALQVVGRAKAPPAAPALAPVLTAVSINTLPWARVKIQAAENPSIVPTDGEVTPCSLLLQPGDYMVTLTGESQGATMQQKIHVEPGRSNSFVFRLPGYDPKQVASRILEAQ